MGKIEKGILGPVSGKVGTVVGAIVRGEPILRSVPKKSTKPPKPSQINQRTRFGLATEFIASLRRVVDIGYLAYSAKMSPANAAVQDLLNKAITGEAPDFGIDYAKVRLSKGKLYSAQTMKAVARATGSTVDLTWDPAELSESDQLLFAKDQLTVAMYSEKLDRFVTYVHAAPRSAGTRAISVPPLYAGSPVHVWVFFSKEDDSQSSESQYLGTVIPVV